MMSATLIAAAFLAKAAQLEMQFGEPSSRIEKSLVPVVKCVWKKKYPAALSLANRFGRGIILSHAVADVGLIGSDCTRITNLGHYTPAFLKVLLWHRPSAVGQCFMRADRRGVERSLQSLRQLPSRLREDQLVEQLPPSLRVAAMSCDPLLLEPGAYEERLALIEELL
jgi:hypothetical protein